MAGQLGNWELGIGTGIGNRNGNGNGNGESLRSKVSGRSDIAVKYT